MPKTEYRIVPIKDWNGFVDMYLQFKSIKIINYFFFKEHKQVWRFIPNEMYYISKFITENDCPIDIGFLGKYRLFHSFYGCESLDLIPFTKQYVNIEDYFKFIHQKRIKYLKEQEEENNAKEIYL